MAVVKRAGLCALRGAEVALAFLALSFALDRAFGTGDWPRGSTFAFAAVVFVVVAAARWTGRDEGRLYKLASRSVRSNLARAAITFLCVVLAIYVAAFVFELVLQRSLPTAVSALLDALGQTWAVAAAALAVGLVLGWAECRRAMRFAEGVGDQGNSPKDWAVEAALVALVCALLLLVPVKPADPTTFEGTWRLCGVVEEGLDATAANASVGSERLEEHGLADTSGATLRIDGAGVVKYTPGLEWSPRQDVDGSCFVQERTITSILGHELLEPTTVVYTFRLDSGYLIVSPACDAPGYSEIVKVYEKVR